jgi:hypothetical protein
VRFTLPVPLGRVDCLLVLPLPRAPMRLLIIVGRIVRNFATKSELFF